MIISEHLLLFILFIVLGGSALVQLFYYLYYYLAPVKYKHPEMIAEKGLVSVIICARNEEENLKNFLPSVLEQDYPDFEVIVVNDCSEDDSYNVLGEFLKSYPNLRVSNITKDPKFTHNKKFAQFIGIKAAKNEILLFTDADCKPESSDWISGMAGHLDKKIDFVLGYGGYFKEKGILNKYIRYDSMFIATQYLGMAIRGIPFMGVGRNLVYRRSLFFEKKGFGIFSHLSSGDDDLFVNAYASSDNSTVEFRKEAHTRSVPASSTEELIKQKQRHFTTARYYKLRDKLVLIAEPALRMIFYILFIILISKLFLWPFLLAIFGIRLTAQIIVLTLMQNRLNERGLLAWSLIFDIFSPIINGSIYLTNFRRGPGKNTWK